MLLGWISGTPYCQGSYWWQCRLEHLKGRCVSDVHTTQMDSLDNFCDQGIYLFQHSPIILPSFSVVHLSDSLNYNPTCILSVPRKKNKYIYIYIYITVCIKNNLFMDFDQLGKLAQCRARHCLQPKWVKGWEAKYEISTLHTPFYFSAPLYKTSSYTTGRWNTLQKLYNSKDKEVLKNIRSLMGGTKGS